MHLRSNGSAQAEIALPSPDRTVTTQKARTRAFLAKLTPKDCDLQTKCPLFTRLPPELRNIVFSLVLTPFNDKKRPYNKRDLHWRPEYQAPRILDLRLMLTCRLVYYETRGVATQNTPLTFFDDGTGYSMHQGALNFRYVQLEGMGLKTRQGFTTLNFNLRVRLSNRHIVRYMFNRRNPLKLQPRFITITFGSTAWSRWMTDPPSVKDLETNGRWLTKELVFPKSVEEIRIIFETTEEWKAHLTPIVAAASKWTFGLHKGGLLSLTGDPHTDSWIGPRKDIRRGYGVTDENSRDFRQGWQRRRDITALLGATVLTGDTKYCNFALTWRRSPESI